MHESYTYEFVNLKTDSGKPGFRTMDKSAAIVHAIEQAEATSRRQVIEVFPYSEQPSRDVYRVVEADLEHVPSPEKLARIIDGIDLSRL